ncbi:MAG: DUF255 domain-containing protein [Bacteroidetes bacterium]|nr:DUF255 domain-containing protein [Bacteroidota bacterium]
MKSKILLLAICFALFNVSFSPEEKTEGGIKWMTFKEALAQSEKSPKKIFIDMYTGWCGWCKKMDAYTFKDPKVVKYMNEHYYAVKFDAETHDTVYFQNKAYYYKAEYKSNEIAVYLLNGQMSYPTAVYLDEKTAPITAVPGYQTPEQLFRFLLFGGG